MCPKGNQSDVEKWLCHIQHIFPTPISHMTSPALNPVRSPSASYSALPSGSGPWLHLFPSHSPPLPTLLAPPTPTMPLPSPHPLSALTPQCFDTPALKFCDYWNQALMLGSFNLKFTHLQVCAAPSVCCWTTFIGSRTFIHAFFLAFFALSPSLSPPQLPSLKFPFLKYASSLKAFIINLSRNYLRDSSAVLWFIRCGGFLAGISQELSWSSFYLHR